MRVSSAYNENDRLRLRIPGQHSLELEQGAEA